MTDKKSIEIVLFTLRSATKKLHEIDADQLGRDAKNKLTNILDNCTTAALKLESVDLLNLADAFKKREPELIAASEKLQGDLKGLEDFIRMQNKKN